MILSNYGTSLYSKVRSPPYYCAVLLDQRLEWYTFLNLPQINMDIGQHRVYYGMTFRLPFLLFKF